MLVFIVILVVEILPVLRGGGLKFVNFGFNPNLTCFTGFHGKFSSM